MNDKLKKAAKEYLGLGISVMPTKIKKEPTIAWDCYQEQLMEVAEVDRLFEVDETVGIGIVTGVVSGNLEVIDVDCQNDPTGKLWQKYEALINEQLPGLLQKIVISKSMSGGYHLYYRCEVIGANEKLASKQKIKGGSGKHLTLIETRGEGGYIVACPSEGYEILRGDFKCIPTIAVEERNLLMNISRSFDLRVPKEKKSKKKSKASNDSAIVHITSTHGAFEDYNQNANSLELMEKHGWKLFEKEGDERVAVQRPGETGNKTSGNYHKDLKVLRVFSSSTDFDPEIGYNPVGIFTILECHGDVALASSRLYDQGYGKAIQQSDAEKELNVTSELEPKLMNLSRDSIKERLTNMLPSIDSGYKINGESIMIPCGAVTVIAAPTNHGKTTVKADLAVNIAKVVPVYFISYEERPDAVFIRCISNSVKKETGQTFSDDMKSTIRHYLMTGSTKYIKNDDAGYPESKSNEHNSEVFIGAVDKFYDDIIIKGNFILDSEKHSSGDLVKIIRFLKNNTNVGAIFIDYIQHMEASKGRNFKSRQEEVKKICIDLNDIAIETGLAIITGAQFNRNVVSPETLHVTNIGEAGDIERIANLIIGFWNNNLDAKENGKGKVKPERNTIFVKILKNRDGKVGQHDTWTFDGNTGTLGNIPKKEFKKFASK